jgi:hypothetical protein
VVKAMKRNKWAQYMAVRVEKVIHKSQQGDQALRNGHPPFNSASFQCNLKSCIIQEI